MPRTKRSRATTRKPKPPFPRQSQRRPGSEARMTPRPAYLAPNYRGSGRLAGRVALITGGDSGIGRSVAVLFAREGANVTIVCLKTETDDAAETKTAVEQDGARRLVLPGAV